MSNTDDIDLSMLDLFRIEVENNSKLLEGGLVEVEQNQTSENIEPLMRAAHSIKGAARMVGLPLVVTLAHAMEDVLSAAQHGKLTLAPDHIDALLRGNDLFTHLSRVDPPAIPEWLQDQADSIAGMSDGVRAILAGGPAPAPAPTSGPPGNGAEKPQATTREEADLPKPRRPEPPPPDGAAPRRRPAEKDEKGSVRVVSDSLNRLMGYAGECLVQAKSAKPFSAALLRMKEEHMEVVSGLENLQGTVKVAALSREIEERLGEYLKKLDRMHDFLGNRIADFELFSRRLERLADKLYEEVVAIRMRPFADGVTGFPRMVRDLARSMGKRVDFQILGESTRVDRDLLEKLEAPLVHLLRNAVDHGVGTPEARLAMGKPVEAKLTLEARHASGMLHVRLSDDGRGIDCEGLRRKVVEKGYVTAEMAVSLTETELLDFIFLPGFSTAAKVTEVSGRGVGLDVVLSMVQEVGGAVRVETKMGVGTTFSLILPITLSVLRALLVAIGGQPYAIPMSRIDRVVECAPDRLRVLEGRQFYPYEGENVGIIDARQVLELPGSTDHDGDFCIVIVSDRLNRYGLIVDRFLDRRELVLTPLDPRLGKIPDVSAGTILEDGTPSLVLDVDDMVRSMDNLLTQGRLAKVAGRKECVQAACKRILVVDDSLTVREVERRLLENSGYEVTVAVDGVDGWNTLQLRKFDLVISDIDMPRMNGIELIRKIKGDPEHRGLPVIIVSYKDREEDRLRGLEAGANYYLTKSSFHDEGLKIAVRDLIGEP